MIDITLKKGLKKTIVKLYDNIDQLPIERFNKANKFWMLHDNIGSSIGDFDEKHYSKLVLLAGEKAKCLAELSNLRIMVYNIMNEINVEHLSFACLIHSINREEQNDLSDEALGVVLKRLSDSGLTQEALKKKLQPSGRGFTGT